MDVLPSATPPGVLPPASSYTTRPRFVSPGFSGYSVQFSPFEEYKLALVAAQHFGIVGNGKLFILGMDRHGVQLLRSFDTNDGLFECAWSEINENQIATASGDGTIKLWDTNLADFPIQVFHEHQKEVYGLSWNLIRKDSFVSGSWDNTIKVWVPAESPNSLVTYQEHTYCIYATNWSPHNADVFASVSGDCTLKIWDIKSPHSVQTIRGHDNEILTMDWNKYQDGIVVTGSVDRTIKEWDLRFPNREVGCFRGHRYAVRRVKYSPHRSDVFASASYDMSVRLWNRAVEDSLLETIELHTEFAVGLDFNLYLEGLLATCGWDETVNILYPASLMPAPPSPPTGNLNLK